MTQIAFGTSGWRGILCEDFTFENVRVVIQAIADHLAAFVTRRDNLKLSSELENAYDAKIYAVQGEIAGTKVKEIIRIVGTKLLLEDGSWMLFRKSGTEPVVRLYGEAANDARLSQVMEAGRKFILN